VSHAGRKALPLGVKYATGVKMHFLAFVSSFYTNYKLRSAKFNETQMSKYDWSTTHEQVS